ncbi:MAG: hypothetical protein C0432_04590 [Candidatus Puniceispirillum sp.]|nr:hypothetical protein [Candidatus Pelagibacter sp.]MBA4283554.1 hypothetical protein [Candidatus Puniceispirillum sp.]
MILQNYLITENDTPSRLDRYLKRQISHLNQTSIQKWIRSKDIRLNGHKTAADTSLIPGDSITLSKFIVNILSQPQEPIEFLPAYKQEDMEFFESMIIFDDDDFLILNKPAGLAAQGGSKTNYHIDLLLKTYAHFVNIREPFRLVHRLDKDTSGLVVIAKNLRTSQYFANLFKTKEVQKKYWAFVTGKLKNIKGEIDAPLLKRAGYNNLNETMVVDHEEGKKAITLYRQIKNINDKNLKWIELQPITGRTHQLRAHTSHIGCPILGDKKYGERLEKETEKHLFLHARSIQFRTPDGTSMTFVAPPPPHFEKVFKENSIFWEKYD